LPKVAAGSDRIRKKRKEKDQKPGAMTPHGTRTARRVLSPYPGIRCIWSRPMNRDARRSTPRAVDYNFVTSIDVNARIVYLFP
jgi:hypothetical protein